MSRRIKLPRLRGREQSEAGEGQGADARDAGASEPAPARESGAPESAGRQPTTGAAASGPGGSASATGSVEADRGTGAGPGADPETPTLGPLDYGESRLARVRRSLRFPSGVAIGSRLPRVRKPTLPRLRRGRGETSAAEPASAAGTSATADTAPSRFDRYKRPALYAAALLLAAGAGVAVGWAIFDSDSERARIPAVAPTVVIEELPEPEAAEQIGFPAFATRNTTRVGGADPIADAAGVALASFPSVGGVGGPKLAVIAPADNWQAVLAASSLAARRPGAPILLGRLGEIPGFTAEALSGLSPTGLKRADGVQVLTINEVASPAGLKEREVPATDDPAELALRIDRQRAQLSGRQNPAHILVTTADDPAYAMPAAAWAARSGDPIAFADGDEVPEPTIEMLERHPDAQVYVLGPESVIGQRALRRLERTSGRAIRVGAEDPIQNAINFARFTDGSFGWNINDPGHGFTIANTSRPADAGAGAPLAAGGKPGPMLLTDSATEVPQPLRNFLLDTKPGFTEDPARAVYNHVWLLGDTSAISLAFQSQVDELTELAPVRRGAGVPDFGLDTGAPEKEPGASQSGDDPGSSSGDSDGDGAPQQPPQP